MLGNVPSFVDGSHRVGQSRALGVEGSHSAEVHEEVSLPVFIDSMPGIDSYGSLDLDGVRPGAFYPVGYADVNFLFRREIQIIFPIVFQQVGSPCVSNMRRGYTADRFPVYKIL